MTALYPPLESGGHDERCRQVVEALAKRGHRVQVLTSDHRVPPMGVDEDKAVYRKLKLDRSVDENTPLGRTYEATYLREKANVDILLERVGSFKPDLVYVWNKRGLSHSLLFSLQSKKIPIVYDLHDNWLKEENYRLDPWRRWWLENSSKRSKVFRSFLTITSVARKAQSYMPLGRSDELDLSFAYVSSYALKKELVNSGLTNVEELKVVYPALNPSLFQAKSAFVKGGRRFMWAGRLIKQKNPVLALLAVEMLRKEGIEVQLDFFGIASPAQRKSFRKRIDRMGLADLVNMIGIRPGEITGYYNQYDAFLVTSKSNDPFPITPFEAMFSKLPCIISQDGGLCEVVRDGETALTYDANSPADLATKMKYFISLQDAGESIAEQCYSSLLSNFDLNKRILEIENILSVSVGVLPDEPSDG